MRKTQAAAAAILLSTLVPAAPAFAAPPDNDLYAGREIIAGLPFEATLDTSEATTDAFDAEFSATCEGIPSTDASVWYEYTPTVTGAFIIDVSASDYSAGAVVAVPDGYGGWMVDSCGPERIAFYGEAGAASTIMIFDDQSDGSGNGGSLRMSIDEAPPGPTIDLEVNPTATFNSKTGDATISGTYTCTTNDNASAWAAVDIELTQKVGRFEIHGYSGTDLACDGTQRPWSVIVSADNGMFKGGKAANVSWWYGCGDVMCSEGFVESTVQLKGGKR